VIQLGRKEAMSENGNENEQPTLRDLLGWAVEAGASTNELPESVADPDLQILSAFMAAQNALLGVIASAAVEIAELVTDIDDVVTGIYVEMDERKARGG
jgi:F420-dependent methylenetetrahydromethanopterin dehydrogenase